MLSRTFQKEPKDHSPFSCYCLPPSQPPHSSYFLSRVAHSQTNFSQSSNSKSITRHSNSFQKKSLKKRVMKEVQTPVRKLSNKQMVFQEYYSPKSINKKEQKTILPTVNHHHSQRKLQFQPNVHFSYGNPQSIYLNPLVSADTLTSLPRNNSLTIIQQMPSLQSISPTARFSTHELRVSEPKKKPEDQGSVLEGSSAVSIKMNSDKSINQQSNTSKQLRDSVLSEGFIKKQGHRDKQGHPKGKGQTYLMSSDILKAKIKNSIEVSAKKLSNINDVDQICSMIDPQEIIEDPKQSIVVSRLNKGKMDESNYLTTLGLKKKQSQAQTAVNTASMMPSTVRGSLFKPERNYESKMFSRLFN